MIIKLGEFYNKSGEFMVSDPCYSRGTWCQKVIESVATGQWIAYVDRAEIEGWGRRNTAIYAIHESLVDKKYDADIGHRESIIESIKWLEYEEATIGVDSGLAGIFDNESFAENGEFYNNCCEITNTSMSAGITDAGFVSIAGIEDGLYCLYISKDENDLVTAISVGFMTGGIYDDDDEESSDYDNDPFDGRLNRDPSNVCMARAEFIAKICHEVNKTYCEEILGDFSQKHWEDAEDWQKESAINGVLAHLDGTLSPEDSHRNWMKDKIKAGWKYGPVKDVDKKEHPCMVAYELLPKEQQTKDKLFKAVCESFKNAMVLRG